MTNDAAQRPAPKMRRFVARSGDQVPFAARGSAADGMGAIALFTIDIFSIGSGWLAEEVQNAQ